MHLRDQQTVGSHFKGKPSDQGQHKFKNWEGKGEKSPSFEQKAVRWFSCGETGRFKTQCVKNRGFGQQKENLNLPKKVNHIEQNEALTGADEVGAIATAVSARAKNPEQQEPLPIAQICQGYLTESNQEHVKSALGNTHSQKENKEKSEENPEFPNESIRGNDEIADLVTMRNPNENTFKNY